MSATWIVGQGGLLGSAVARRRDDRRLFHSGPIPWGTPRSIDSLRASLDRFLADVRPGALWSVIWAAGAGVIGSSPADLEREAVVFQDFLSILAERRETPDGCFFLTSSASVYAGSSGPPFDEETAPVPLNAYGRAKQEQEQAAFRILNGRLPLAVGRISTLYGPGQKLSKPQGLVSQLCLQASLRRPITIYVPMDTTRDYLYVDDAAKLVWGEVRHLEATRESRLRVLASERGTTIAELVAVVQRVSRVKLRLIQRIASPSSGHVRDLRVRSRLTSGTRYVEPLQCGVQRVHDDVWAAFQRGQFAPTLLARP